MDIHIIVNESELGAGTRGASLGYRALKVASWKKHKPIFAPLPKSFIETYNDELDTPVKNNFAKRIPFISKVYQQLQQRIPEVISRGEFPIIIAGDHSSAGGSIAGFKAAFPDEQIGVVWIDAHADLHTPYTTPSGNVHGMPLGSALALDENGPNPVNATEAQAWKDLINLGGVCPKVMGKHLKMVGVRSLEKDEIRTMRKQGIVNYDVADLRKYGAEPLAIEILEELKDCSKIYVSFDVDAMDSDIASEGTGTPVLNGLFPEEVIWMLTTLLKDERVRCLEFVEINPCLDNKRNTMAEITLDILEECINTIKSR